MHQLLHISLALSLLALTAGTFLYLKVKAENTGGFARWVAWIIIVCSSLMIVFDVVHAAMGRGHGMECCSGMAGCGSYGEGGSCGMQEEHAH